MSDVAYLVMDSTGRLVEATADARQAWARASSLGPTFWLVPGDVPQALARANPKALRLAGLPSVSEQEVRRLSIKAAHKILLPYFEEANRAVARLPREAKSTVATTLGAWLRLGSGWLAANTKLAKRDERHPPAVALGLNLVPERTVFTGKPEAGAQLAGVTPASAVGGATLCSRASPECRASCLVYTGQNASDIRNTYSKFARSKALVEQPQAFLRILLEALERYAGASIAELGGAPGKAVRFVRLNILSDVPWEDVAPWIFRLPGLSFYDYTKVPGRHPQNYDLSFSFSGKNWSDCTSEWQQGRRVVMAFAAPEYQRKQTILSRRRSLKRKKLTDKQALRAWLELNPLPTSFRSPLFNDGQPAPVLDGDVSDLRPFDPPGHIVGLRWKPPSITDEETGKRHQARYSEKPTYFVLAGHVVETPRGWLTRSCRRRPWSRRRRRPRRSRGSSPGSRPRASRPARATRATT